MDLAMQITNMPENKLEELKKESLDQSKKRLHNDKATQPERVGR